MTMISMSEIRARKESSLEYPDKSIRKRQLTAPEPNGRYPFHRLNSLQLQNPRKRNNTFHVQLGDSKELAPSHFHHSLNLRKLKNNPIKGRSAPVSEMILKAAFHLNGILEDLQPVIASNASQQIGADVEASSVRSMQKKIYEKMLDKNNITRRQICRYNVTCINRFKDSVSNQNFSRNNSFNKSIQFAKPFNDSDTAFSTKTSFRQTKIFKNTQYQEPIKRVTPDKKRNAISTQPIEKHSPQAVKLQIPGTELDLYDFVKMVNGFIPQSHFTRKRFVTGNSRFRQAAKKVCINTSALFNY